VSPVRYMAAHFRRGLSKPLIHLCYLSHERREGAIRDELQPILDHLADSRYNPD